MEEPVTGDAPAASSNPFGAEWAEQLKAKQAISENLDARAKIGPVDAAISHLWIIFDMMDKVLDAKESRERGFRLDESIQQCLEIANETMSALGSAKLAVGVEVVPSLLNGNSELAENCRKLWKSLFDLCDRHYHTKGVEYTSYTFTLSEYADYSSDDPKVAYHRDLIDVLGQVVKDTISDFLGYSEDGESRFDTANRTWEEHIAASADPEARAVIGLRDALENFWNETLVKELHLPEKLDAWMANAVNLENLAVGITAHWLYCFVVGNLASLEPLENIGESVTTNSRIAVLLQNCATIAQRGDVPTYKELEVFAEVSSIAAMDASVSTKVVIHVLQQLLGWYAVHKTRASNGAAPEKMAAVTNFFENVALRTWIDILCARCIENDTDVKIVLSNITNLDVLGLQRFGKIVDASAVQKLGAKVKETTETEFTASEKETVNFVATVKSADDSKIAQVFIRPCESGLIGSNDLDDFIANKLGGETLSDFSDSEDDEDFVESQSAEESDDDDDDDDGDDNGQDGSEDDEDEESASRASLYSHFGKDGMEISADDDYFGVDQDSFNEMTLSVIPYHKGGDVASEIEIGVARGPFENIDFVQKVPVDILKATFIDFLNVTGRGREIVDLDVSPEVGYKLQISPEIMFVGGLGYKYDDGAPDEDPIYLPSLVVLLRLATALDDDDDNVPAAGENTNSADNDEDEELDDEALRDRYFASEEEEGESEPSVKSRVVSYAYQVCDTFIVKTASSIEEEWKSARPDLQKITGHLLQLKVLSNTLVDLRATEKRAKKTLSLLFISLETPDVISYNTIAEMRKGLDFAELQKSKGLFNVLSNVLLDLLLTIMPDSRLLAYEDIIATISSKGSTDIQSTGVKLHELLLTATHLINVEFSVADDNKERVGIEQAIFEMIKVLVDKLIWENWISPGIASRWGVAYNHVVKQRKLSSQPGRIHTTVEFLKERLPNRGSGESTDLFDQAHQDLLENWTSFIEGTWKTDVSEKTGLVDTIDTVNRLSEFLVNKDNRLVPPADFRYIFEQVNRHKELLTSMVPESVKLFDSIRTFAAVPRDLDAADAKKFTRGFASYAVSIPELPAAAEEAGAEESGSGEKPAKKATRKRKRVEDAIATVTGNGSTADSENAFATPKKRSKKSEDMSVVDDMLEVIELVKKKNPSRSSDLTTLQTVLGELKAQLVPVSGAPLDSTDIVKKLEAVTNAYKKAFPSDDDEKRLFSSVAARVKASEDSRTSSSTVTSENTEGQKKKGKAKTKKSFSIEIKQLIRSIASALNIDTGNLDTSPAVIAFTALLKFAFAALHVDITGLLEALTSPTAAVTPDHLNALRDILLGIITVDSANEILRMYNDPKNDDRKKTAWHAVEAFRRSIIKSNATTGSTGRILADIGVGVFVPKKTERDSKKEPKAKKAAVTTIDAVSTTPKSKPEKPKKKAAKAVDPINAGMGALAVMGSAESPATLAPSNSATRATKKTPSLASNGEFIKSWGLDVAKAMDDLSKALTENADIEAGFGNLWKVVSAVSDDGGDAVTGAMGVLRNLYVAALAKKATVPAVAKNLPLLRRFIVRIVGCSPLLASLGKVKDILYPASDNNNVQVDDSQLNDISKAITNVVMTEFELGPMNNLIGELVRVLDKWAGSDNDRKERAKVVITRVFAVIGCYVPTSGGNGGKIAATIKKGLGMKETDRLDHATIVESANKGLGKTKATYKKGLTFAFTKIKSAINDQSSSASSTIAQPIFTPGAQPDTLNVLVAIQAEERAAAALTLLDYPAAVKLPSPSQVPVTVDDDIVFEDVADASVSDPDSPEPSTNENEPGADLPDTGAPAAADDDDAMDVDPDNGNDNVVQRAEVVSVDESDPTIPSVVVIAGDVLKGTFANSMVNFENGYDEQLWVTIGAVTEFATSAANYARGNGKNCVAVDYYSKDEPAVARIQDFVRDVPNFNLILQGLSDREVKHIVKNVQSVSTGNIALRIVN